MTHIGHADGPIRHSVEDQLGLLPYARSLAEFITRCETPMTVAIQGDWGTGKTSLMNMVAEELRRTSRPESILTLWVNTWQYAQFAAEERLPQALLSSFLRQLVPGGNTQVSEIIKTLKRFARPVTSTAVRMATAGAIEFGDFWASRGNADLAAEAEKIRATIHKLIAEKRNNGIERIYVFVDDLDRVEPRRSVELLEIIKSFLDWEGCVFIIAIDYAVVRRGLKQRFGIDETDVGGRSFFDKLIQLPFTVPVARFDIERYMRGLLEGMGIAVASEDCTRFAALATHSVTANPRAIKRLLNSFQLLMLVAEASEVIGDDGEGVSRTALRNLFAVVCLQFGFEPIYNWLAGRGSQLAASDLNALTGAGSGTRPPDLQEAMDALPGDRAQAFEAFVATFLNTIEDPDKSVHQYDRQELLFLGQAITLSRVTSVKVAGEAEREIDVEFRYSNRKLLKELQEIYSAELERELGRKPELMFYQAQNSEQASLYLRHPTAKSVKLELWHEPENVWVYVHGGRGFKEAEEYLLGSGLYPRDQLERGGGRLNLLHMKMPSALSFEERRKYLLERPMADFVRTAAALDRQGID